MIAIEEAKQLPPPITEGGERIKQRPYDTPFAQLPDAEVVVPRAPGAGPFGGLDDGPRNWPLATVVVGFVVIWAAFGLEHWAPLAAGLALMVVGAIWGLMRARPLRLWKGVGTVRVEEE